MVSEKANRNLLSEMVNIEIPDEAAEQIDTVGKAVDHISEKVGATA